MNRRIYHARIVARLALQAVVVIAFSACGTRINSLPNLKLATSASVSAIPTVSFSGPVAGLTMGAAGITSVTVNGTCSENGRAVSVSAGSGAVTATPTCTANAWTTNLDLTPVSDGAFSITANHMNAAGLNAVQASRSFIKDTTPPTLSISAPSSTLVLATTGSITFTVNYTGSTSVNLTSGNITLNTTGGSSCTKTVTNGTTASATVTLSACAPAGGTVGISIAAGTAQDAAGNTALGAGPSAVVSVVTAPTLALSDGTTGSTNYIRQTSSTIAIGNDASAAKWCVSETQTSAPATGAAACSGGAGGSNGWFTSRPSTFTFSSGDGLKTAYLWIADSGGGVLNASVNASITLDSTPPPAPTVVLSDPNTSSTVNTNHADDSISITGDTGAVKWCLIETLSTAPAPTAPLYNDVCFVGARPTTYTLAGRGIRKVYVYTEDLADNVSSTAGTATLDFPLPSVLTLTGPSSIPQSGCSDPIVLTDKDSYGLLSPSPINNAVTLSGAGAGAYYSDAGCTASITQVINSGETSKTFYFKSGTAGALTLHAAGFSTFGDLSTSVDPVYVAAMGNLTACAVVNGGAQCWGSGNAGELGLNGNAHSSSVALQVTGLTGSVSSISSGRFVSCAVVDGAAQCWGANYSGQLGNGTTNASSTPATVTGLGTGTRYVAAGYDFACAIVGESAKCWGSNSSGQLGNGSTGGISTVPVAVTGLTSGVTRIAIDMTHACAVVNGGLKCWGSNSYGELGNNSTTASNVPVDVTGMSSGVTAVSVGLHHTCAIKNGAAFCWGANNALQSGDPATSNILTPHSISGLTSGVTSIAAGDAHSCVVVSGAVQCWGTSSKGALGSGNLNTATDTPVAVPSLTAGVRDVSVGYFSSCATLTNGQFRCWGGNEHGQLGNSRTALSLSPVPVTGLGNTVSMVSVSANQTCAVLTDGRIQCWGMANLGNADSHDSTAPVYLTGIASGATYVSLGYSVQCAVVSGAVKCWGTNVGNGTSSGYNWPQQVSGLTSGATRVSTSQRYTNSACAVVSGGVQCWGENGSGQLGIAAGATQLSPVQVTNLAAGAGVTEVAMGASHACALVGGAVQCWGLNSSGQLGNGTSTNSFTPVVAVASGATAIAAGENFSCAVVSGSAKCWGSNSGNNLGNGDWTNHNTPVTATGLTSGVTAITAGASSACAVLSTGKVRCWGYSFFGEGGNGNVDGVEGTPVPVMGINSGATQASAALFHSCAVVSGVPYCWGDDSYGLLGDQPDLYSPTVYTPILGGSAAKLTVTGPATSTAGSCSTAFTVRLRDSAGNLVNAGSTLSIDLSNGGSGSFYATAGCGGATVTSVSMGSGTSTATFYYLAPSPQNVGLVVNSTGFVRTAINHTAN